MPLVFAPALLLAALGGLPQAVQSEPPRVNLAAEMETIERLVDASPVIVLVRAVDLKSEIGSRRVGATPAKKVATEVLTLEVVERVKGGSGPKVGPRFIEIRRAATPVAQAAGGLEPPLVLTKGDDCLLFLNQVPLTDRDLGWGGQTGFVGRSGRVHPLRPSRLGDEWRDKPWDDFLTAVRKQVERPVAERSHPTDRVWDGGGHTQRPCAEREPDEHLAECEGPRSSGRHAGVGRRPGGTG